MPSARSNPNRLPTLRHSTARIWDRLSFNVKYTWPDVGRPRLDISPPTQTTGISSSSSPLIRAVSCETVHTGTLGFGVGSSRGTDTVLFSSGHRAILTTPVRSRYSGRPGERPASASIPLNYGSHSTVLGSPKLWCRRLACYESVTTAAGESPAPQLNSQPDRKSVA